MICSMRIRLVWAALGISAGLMAGTVFAFMYQNYLATALAYFSSICAAYVYYLHMAYHRSWMFSWSERKCKAIVLINTIICVIGLVGMLVCLVLAFIWGQGISGDSLKGMNLWIAAVWCWMTFKWSMTAAVYARQYSRKVMRPLTSTVSAPGALYMSGSTNHISTQTSARGQT